MAQPQYPGMPPIIVTQVNNGGGCSKGIGMGAGLVIGCIGIVFIGLILSGTMCAGIVGGAAKAASEAAARRREEEAKKAIVVRWKRDDSYLDRTKFTEAEKAKRVISVRIEVENDGYDSVVLNPANFRLELNGVSYGSPFSKVNSRLDTATISKGLTAGGALAFEVPDETTKFTLTYSPNSIEHRNVRVETLLKN